MKKHPYLGLPSHARWRQAMATRDPAAVDPVVEAAFHIGAEERVMTAGSCFAQHVGRYLARVGDNYLVTEEAHPLSSDDQRRELNYGVFTARYGNIYTTRQLVQLFDRAYGRFEPRESVWREKDGSFRDPFRPNVQPKGFESERELLTDRVRHFRAVREAFETLDVFVFTFGLTEAWRDRRDGAVFPVCPGVSGGEFDPDVVEFVNFEVDEVTADFLAFAERLRAVNPKARIITTVSPVPLAATAEKRHVLVSTVWSKSVLRIAAERVRRALPDCAYFPSYELITAPYAGETLFAADMRNVTEEGVERVMRLFARHYLGKELPAAAESDADAGGVRRRARAESAALRKAFDVQCDEEALDIR